MNTNRYIKIATLAGARNAEQAVANAKTMDITLTPDDLQFINDQLLKFQS